MTSQRCIKLKVEAPTRFHRKLTQRAFKPMVLKKSCSSRRMQLGRQLVAHASVSVASSPPRRNPVLDRDVQLDWQSDFYEKYEFVHKLNSGSFGKVWLARDLATGESVAVKEISKTRGRLSLERVRQKVEQEVKVMQTLRIVHWWWA